MNVLTDMEDLKSMDEIFREEDGWGKNEGDWFNIGDNIADIRIYEGYKNVIFEVEYNNDIYRKSFSYSEIKRMGFVDEFDYESHLADYLEGEKIAFRTH